jgi:SNF2 family DNA or RNA helicase
MDPGALKYHVYHGKMRNKASSDFSAYDLVFTTYSVVSQEWRKVRSDLTGLGKLHSHEWRRIVLDEGKSSEDFSY